MPKLIFLVDDQDLVRRSLVRAIARFRPEDTVVDFFSPRELLKTVLEGRKPDLILTDRNMPELDGDTLASNLKYTGYEGSVVMITADDIVTPPPHVDELMKKPYEMKDFREMLDRHLDRP